MRSCREAALRSGGGSEPSTDLACDQGDLLSGERLAGDLQRGAKRGGVEDRDAVHQQLVKPRQAGNVDAQHRVEAQVGAEAETRLMVGNAGGRPQRGRGRSAPGVGIKPLGDGITVVF
jgi:hypothetical protein